MGTRSFTIGIAFSQSKDRQLLKQYINDLGYQLVDILTDDQHHGLTDDIDLYFIEYALAKKYETQLLRLREKSTVKLELVPILVGLPNKANPNPWLKAGFNDIIRLPLSKEVLATRFEVWLRIQEESQLRFRSLYENATLGLYRTTPEGKILLANPTLVKMLGYNTLEDLQERNLEMEGFEPGYERAAFRRRLEQEEIIRGLESVWKRKDGSSIYIRESARVIKDAKGKPLYYEGTVEDITERKQVEISLKESERKYRQLVNSIRDAILVADTERNIIDCNPAFTNLFGYTLEDIQGKKTMVVYANEEQFYELGQAIREYYKGGEPFLYTVNYKKKNGDVFPGETGVYYLKDSRGNIIGFIGLIRDITERLAAEQELKRSLKEKEVLLKEIHHRVKNNLQMISSLLNLQAESFKDKRVRSLLNESRNRIRSIAMVHETLYQSEDYAQTDFSEYLKNLTLHLIRLYHKKSRRVELKLNVAPIRLPMTLAIPCGLVVNELVTNALKYAFPQAGKGVITISFRKKNTRYLELVIRDNGIGLPEPQDTSESTSLGMELVSILVQDQLKGSLKIERVNGTRIKIQFPWSHSGRT